MDAVPGGEEQPPADVGQRVGSTVVGVRVDVLDQDGAGLGAVRGPQLVAVGAVVRGEVQRARHVGEVGGAVVVVGAGSGVDVLDQDGAGLGAVRGPQLAPVDAVVGGEEQLPAHGGEVAGAVLLVPGAGRLDVLDQDGAGSRAVGGPQLRAVGAVVGGEEQLPAHGGEVVGGIAVVCGAARPDVLDQDRAGSRAVGGPQLRAVGAVVGGEEQLPAHGGEGAGTVASVPGARLDVLDQDGACLGAVGGPQLVPVDAVGRGEEQPSRHVGEVARVAPGGARTPAPGRRGPHHGSGRP